MTGMGFLDRLWFPDIPSCQMTYVEGLLTVCSVLGGAGGGRMSQTC